MPRSRSSPPCGGDTDSSGPSTPLWANPDLAPALGSGSLMGHAGGAWAALQAGEALGWVSLITFTSFI